MEDTARHAMAIVRQADPDRYLSVLFAPETLRPALFALHAFNAETASVRERISEPLPGEIRLQWWRDVFDAYGQAGIAAAQGNPLAEALLSAIADYGLPVAAFDNLLEARLFDLYDDPMPSRDALEGYCGETASAIIQLASLILDPARAPGFAEAAGHAGCAQTIAALVRMMPVHRRRGQCYVPAEILSAAGTSRDEFVSAEPGEGGRRAVQAMIALGLEHDVAFRRGAQGLPSSLRPAFMPAALARSYLRKAGSRHADPLHHVADIGPLRRYGLTLRHASFGIPGG